MICVTDNFCSISYICHIRSFHLYTLKYLESGYNKEHGKKEKIYCYLEHLHRIDQIPKPIAVENINTRHLVEKFFINSRIFHIFSHRIDQILE